MAGEAGARRRLLADAVFNTGKTESSYHGTCSMESGREETYL